MREPHQVIVRPVVTEKSSRQMEEGNVYTFVVAQNANKHEISHAIEKLWDVQVERVRTVNYRGKARRSMMGRLSQTRRVGRRPSFKKAFVTLQEGHHIELYEAG